MTDPRPTAAALVALAALPGLFGACGDATKPAAPSSTARTAPPDEQAVAEAPWFEDVAAASGIDFRHVSGATKEFWFPEVMGGGVALFDYDRDGDLDLYAVQSGDLRSNAGGPGNRLYRNDGSGHFDDVTDAAGVGDTGYGMGATCGDYDRDGDVDLYVTNVGPNVLYRNEGDGTFRDVTAAAGVGHAGWGTSCAFFDADGDGDLDLFVVCNLAWSGAIEIECFNYYHERDYCSPNNYNAPAKDVLYLNQGDGRFVDATTDSGIALEFGNGLGVCWGDYDRDGAFDVYVANDAMPNQLWHNRGDGTFENVALAKGCAVNADGMAEAGMGVQFVDVDADEDLDLFMTHLRMESNTFYMNREGVFADMTHATGLFGRSIKFTGFGTGFADFDHDGTLDLYVANGAVQAWRPPIDPEDAYAEPNLVFRGLGGTHFREVLPEGGTATPALGSSRAAAFGDLDGDGDVDVAVVERDAPLRLLRNVAEKHGHWVRLRVLESDGVDALGASLRVVAGGVTRTREVQVAYSYLASNDPCVHVGLGGAERVDEAVVRWPDGSTESFGPLEGDALHELRRGAGR